MKNSRVSSITYGALLTALLGVLLFFNRQLAGALDTYLFWIIPLPVIVYCMKFSVGRTMTMAVAMIIVSFIIATPVTVFYVAASVIAGTVYGYGMRHQWSALQLIISVIVISMAVMVVSTFLLASFFGIDIMAEINLYKEAIEAFKIGNSELVSIVTSYRFLLSIYIIVCVVTSILEGVLVHLLAYMVLRRLKMELPPMKPVAEIRAPLLIKMYVVISIGLYLYTAITKTTQYVEIILVLTVIAYLICYFFSYLLALTYLSWKIGSTKGRVAVIMTVVILLFIAVPLTVVLGLFDMFTDFRQNIVKEMRQGGKQPQNRQS